MNGSNRTLPARVGYTAGRGTGEELADVFERVMTYLSSRYSISIELQRSPRVFHSYNSLMSDFGNQRDIEWETTEDVKQYEDFCRTQAAQGTQLIFRTAINAQSLYLVRQRLQAVKVEYFNREENALLLVRDESQGFYTGSNKHDLTDDTVSRTCSFSKFLTRRIIEYSISRAREFWGPNGVESVNMVYKFHLFDGVFSTWALEWSKHFGIPVTFIQPDTANRNLLASGGVRGRQLMIAGNEWADIMHVILLDMFGKGRQEARCTENVYLHPDLKGLTEFQTVHGSADDIEGLGKVNPTATLRAAAAILEQHAHCEGAVGAMEHALDVLKEKGVVTADQNGNSSTSEVVDMALEVIGRYVLKEE